MKKMSESESFAKRNSEITVSRDLQNNPRSGINARYQILFAFR